VQPQPKYQEQFTLHRTEQAVDTTLDKPSSYQPSTELLTDFNDSRPQAVHYAEQPPKYNGSAQLNNALKTYLAPLRDQPAANFSVDENIEP
ncbi:DNA mismatch repair protein MutL, partial [Acinetobacter gyllenbergii]